MDDWLGASTTIRADEPEPTVWTEINAIERNLPSGGWSFTAVWTCDARKSDAMQHNDREDSKTNYPAHVGEVVGAAEERRK